MVFVGEGGKYIYWEDRVQMVTPRFAPRATEQFTILWSNIWPDVEMLM